MVASTSPSPSPAPSPTLSFPIPFLTISNPVDANTHPASSPPFDPPIDFSPPLIAMVVVVATAFLIVTYSRLISRHVIPPLIRFSRHWRHRRRRRSYLPSSVGEMDSPPYDSSFAEGFQVFSSPYGLDESVIKTIPLSLYTPKTAAGKDCAVCLIDFEDDEYVRTLPVCSHAFHVDCIDMWLRSHANCPLCRAGVFRPDHSPFIPLMAARIRPSLDDVLLRSLALEHLAETPLRNSESTAEIMPCAPDEQSPPQRRTFSYWEDRINGGDFVLKRSYSFGFERSAGSERMMVTEPTTASPWRYRRGGGGGFWSKRPSPFGSLTKPRVFSFRSHHRRGSLNMKSPFFRRKGFFPMSESSARFSSTGGGGSSRRTKSMTSPMFMRTSTAAFSSSRLRCGDPEALLSPERFNRR